MKEEKKNQQQNKRTIYFEIDCELMYNCEQNYSLQLNNNRSFTLNKQTKQNNNKNLP